MTAFRITYYPNAHKPFHIESLIFNDRFVSTDEGNFNLMPVRGYKTKAGAKKAVKKIIERYLKLFVDGI